MPNILKTTLFYVKKEKLLSISSVIVMAVTFLLLGLFIYLIAVSQTTIKYLEEQAQITIFFKDETTADKIQTIKGDIEKNSKVAEVKYISKEDALRIFKEMNKDEPILLESVSASILPASLEVKAKDISNLRGLVDEYRKIEGVEEVRFFEDVISRFAAFSKSAYIIGFILVLVFLVISYSIVVATLRTSINSRGAELEIQKLVGASDAFVKRPFIYQGVFFGIISAVVSSVFLLIIGFVVFKVGIFSQGLSFGFIPGFYLNPVIFSVGLSLVLLLSGFLLGYIGSQSAIKKYLRF